jgi:hypothetical protein
MAKAEASEVVEGGGADVLLVELWVGGAVISGGGAEVVNGEFDETLVPEVMLSTSELVLLLGGLKVTVSPGWTLMKVMGTAMLSGPPSPISWIAASASPSLVDWRLKVTREFCAIQERLAALSLARMTVPDSGIEKFPRESEMRRGIAVPNVTSSMLRDWSGEMRVVVVQASDLAPVQSEPEKPFVQMQEQTP